MTVKRSDVTIYGFVITSLFDELYPEGETTIEDMKEDAEDCGWICGILPNLEARLILENAPDVSEVGM